MLTGHSRDIALHNSLIFSHRDVTQDLHVIIGINCYFPYMPLQITSKNLKSVRRAHLLGNLSLLFDLTCKYAIRPIQYHILI